MSYFYPQQQSAYNRFPFFDATDHHYSPYPLHQYSSFDPLGLTLPQDDFGHPHHRSPSIPRDRLGRDALENRYARHTRPYRAPTNPVSYEDSVRAERARRLAEAKTRQLAQSKLDEQTKVEVTLPDGRQCVVPLSWAKKMQSKYPNILTNSMIRTHNPPSPPPIRLDQPSASDSDHDSDFFVLDPTQDPSVPSLTGSSAIPIRQSPSPQPPKHSSEDLDSAARLIQKQFRIYQSLKHLDEIESSFHQLKRGFSYPSPLDITFLESHHSHSSAPSKLAFNNPVNRPVQAFEEGLTQLQIKADAVVSDGNLKIKNWRKRLIKEIESQLEQLDRFKSEAWNLQMHSQDKGSTERAHPNTENLSVPPSQLGKVNSQNTANVGEDVEMNEEIINTDNESVALDGDSDSDNDSAALATPIIKPEVMHPTTQAEESLVIPITAPLEKSVESLIIPVNSTTASQPGNMSSCMVNPLVTQEGDLICPALVTSHNSDDILVSPV